MLELADTAARLAQPAVRELGGASSTAGRRVGPGAAPRLQRPRPVVVRARALVAFALVIADAAVADAEIAVAVGGGVGVRGATGVAQIALARGRGHLEVRGVVGTAGVATTVAVGVGLDGARPRWVAVAGVRADDGDAGGPRAFAVAGVTRRFSTAAVEVLGLARLAGDRQPFRDHARFAPGWCAALTWRLPGPLAVRAELGTTGLTERVDGQPTPDLEAQLDVVVRFSL